MDKFLEVFELKYSGRKDYLKKAEVLADTAEKLKKELIDRTNKVFPEVQKLLISYGEKIAKIVSDSELGDRVEVVSPYEFDFKLNGFATTIYFWPKGRSKEIVGIDTPCIEFRAFRGQIYVSSRLTIKPNPIKLFKTIEIKDNIDDMFIEGLYLDINNFFSWMVSLELTSSPTTQES
jgi:hypothetical protein